MKLTRHAYALSSLGLRGATLAIRSGLSFYIVKVLGYEAFGVYGLVLGLVGITPAVIGWGLNYLVAREIVGKMQSEALLLVRDRLVVSVASLSALTLSALAVLPFTGQYYDTMTLLIFLLVWAETLGLDVNQPLIGMDMALLANVVFFIRAASWVIPVAGVGLLFPAARSLEVVLSAWLVGHVLANAVLFLSIRRWPIDIVRQTPIDRAWLRKRLFASWLIYLSDIGLVGFIYLDRYIVGATLGLSFAGIYTFYWSLTNALQTLVQTAVVQLALPTLVRVARTENTDVWVKMLRTEFIRTFIVSLILSAIIFFASKILLLKLGMVDLQTHDLLFISLLLAAMIRSCSDLLSIGFTSINRDRSYAMMNIGGMVMSVGLAFAGIWLYGLEGSGFAAVLTALVLLGARAALLLDRPMSSGRGVVS